MNLANLLLFAPTLIVLFLVYHLIFKKDLPSQGLGKIISYFLGILIISLGASWLVISYLSSWVDDMLQASQSSVELRSVIETSSDILRNSFSNDGTGLATPVYIPSEPINNGNNGSESGTGNNGTGNDNGDVITSPGDPAKSKEPPVALDGNKSNSKGPTNYTVQSGDTLNGVARKFGVTVEDLRTANNLYYSDMIYIDQVLVIPASK